MQPANHWTFIDLAGVIEMSKVEEIEGKRWAIGVCQSFRETMKDWKKTLLKQLEWGLVEKPEGYKVGVQAYIDLVNSASDAQPEISRYAKDE